MLLIKSKKQKRSYFGLINAGTHNFMFVTMRALVDCGLTFSFQRSISFVNWSRCVRRCPVTGVANNNKKVKIARFKLKQLANSGLCGVHYAIW